MYKIQWSITGTQGKDSYDNWTAGSDEELARKRETLHRMTPEGATLTVKVTRAG